MTYGRLERKPIEQLRLNVEYILNGYLYEKYVEMYYQEMYQETLKEFKFVSEDIDLEKEDIEELLCMMAYERLEEGFDKYVPDDNAKMSICECHAYVLKSVFNICYISESEVRFYKDICLKLILLGYDVIFSVIDSCAHAKKILLEV